MVLGSPRKVSFPNWLQDMSARAIGFGETVESLADRVPPRWGEAVDKRVEDQPESPEARCFGS